MKKKVNKKEEVTMKAEKPAKKRTQKKKEPTKKQAPISNKLQEMSVLLDEYDALLVDLESIVSKDVAVVKIINAHKDDVLEKLLTSYNNKLHVNNAKLAHIITLLQNNIGEIKLLK